MGSRYTAEGKLKPFYKEIARRLVLGQRRVDIARHFGVNRNLIAKLFKDPLFKEQVSKYEQIREEAVTKQLKELAPIAVDTLEKMLYHGRSEQTKLRAAEGILDRAGYTPHQRIDISADISHSYSDYTVQELYRIIQQRLFRMKNEMGISNEMEISNEMPNLEVKDAERCNQNLKDTDVLPQIETSVKGG